MAKLVQVRLVEAGIKRQKGKLDAPDSEIDYGLAELGVSPLSITLAHVRLAALLPFLNGHKDPFDRLIAAQAKVEGLPLISADPAFGAYSELEVIW